MAVPHGLSADMVRMGEAILQDKSLTINEIKDKFIKLCDDNHLVHKTAVHTDKLLTHPKNRGSLLLNPYNAHKNGSMIRRVGANIGELHGAEQIASNKRVIESSKGMLANVIGREMYLTLGTGHAAAFCKAANHTCRTPISYLQDHMGNINLAFLKQQPEFKQMLEIGWEFTVLSWKVEAAWPTCPDILQRALNASNEVHSSPTELEGAVTIAEALESGESEADALALATAANPLWKDYGETLVTLAKYYGGGKQVPLLHKLDTFAKTYGENRRLGEEYLQALIGLKLPGSRTLPRVVDMLLTTNMVAPKVVDGIARCITKTDIATLGSKAKFAMLEACEEHLTSMADLAEHLQASGLGEDHVSNLEGLFKVRLGSHLFKKGKSTFEGVDYEDIPSIVRASLKDAHDLIGDRTDVRLPVLSATWKEFLASCPPEKAEARANDAASSTLLSTDDAGSIAEIASRKGYGLHKIVFEKTVGKSQGLYKIKAIDTNRAKLEEVDNFKTTCLTINISMEALMNKWSLFKGDIAAPIADAWAERTKIKGLELEAEKAKLFISIKKVASENEVGAEHVLLCLKPSQLRANDQFARGELVLAPSIPSLAYITHKKTAYDSGYDATVDGSKTRLYLTKPPQPYKPFDDWEQSDVACPFFWVTSTGDASEANMALKFIKDDSVRVPVFTNTKQVSQYTVLQYFKETVAPTPLENAEIQKRERDGEEQHADEPEAKSRRAAGKSKAVVKANKPRVR